MKNKPKKEYSKEKIDDKLTKTEQTKYHLHSKYHGAKEIISNK